MMEKGELEFRHPVEAKVTYHDPCHLGRAAGRVRGAETGYPGHSRH